MVDSFERWKRADAILAQALELSDSARAAFVAEACADDQELRALVDRLLAEEGREPGALRTGAAVRARLGAELAGAAEPMSSDDEISRAEAPRVPPGTTLGHYEIESVLGAGGMGVVYRGRDLRLARSVAIKMLPAELAEEREAMARLRREARMLAAVSHPGVAEIHSVEEAGGEVFLVMELIDGESLDDLLRRELPPLRRTLELARQIAAALEVAHEHGIVHRDLKPGNVMLVDGEQPKLVDFGLARTYATEGSSAEAGVLNESLTRTGVLVGTVPYMSPEQVRREPLDRRTDVWAFGCMLFEMLSGTSPFRRATPADTMGAILEGTPDYEQLPAVTPPPIRRLIGRCLEPDRSRRLQHMGEARIRLDDALTGRDTAAAVAAPSPPEESKPASGVSPLLLVACALLAVVAVWGWTRPAAAPSREARWLEWALPAGHELDVAAGPSIAISADRRTVAFVAREGSRSALMLRRLDTPTTQRIAESEIGAFSVFFSPDGESLGYFEGGNLYRHSLQRGETRLVASTGEEPAPIGATWTHDGDIVFTRSFRSGLMRVPASGGSATPLTELDVERGETSHRLPLALPNGALLYTVLRDHGRERAIWARPPGGEPARKLIDGTHPTWLPEGYLLFARAKQSVRAPGTLLAAPFDAERLEITGPVVTVVDDLFVSRSGTGRYAASDGDLLIYAPLEGRPSRVVVTDPDGGERTITDEPAFYEAPRFSPDGNQVAVAKTNASGRELWIYDTDTAVHSQLTFRTERGTAFPIWSPDGSRIYYLIGGVLAVVDVGGGAPSRVPVAALPNRLHGWVGDDLLATEVRMATVADLLRLHPDGTISEVSADPIAEWAGAVSPDGRWLAVAILDSGTMEIVVRRLAGGGQQWRVAAGATFPTWSADGASLYFSTNRAIVRVPVSLGESFGHGEPVVVYELPRHAQLPNDRKLFDVHPDGERLAVVVDETSPMDRLFVVVDAFEGFRRSLER